MSNIAFMIERPNLLWEGILNVLQNKLPENSINVYESKQYDQFKIENTADLMVVDMITKTDLLTNILECCANKQIKIALCTSPIDSHDLTELFKLDLHGYLCTEMNSNELAMAIKSILDGNKYIHPSLASVLLDDYIRIACKKEERPKDLLTEREWDVLGLIAKGQNNTTIASNLYLSEKTVNNHTSSILRKLHVPDRTSAALLAVKNNWVVL